jgi:hypothetical protein
MVMTRDSFLLPITSSAFSLSWRPPGGLSESRHSYPGATFSGIVEPSHGLKFYTFNGAN